MNNPRDLNTTQFSDQMNEGEKDLYRVTNSFPALGLFLCDQVCFDPAAAQESVFGEASRLVCPDCGDVRTHVQGVYTILGGEESEGLYRGSHLIARRTGEARDGLAVRIRCENGHWYDIVFQQREGTTFVEFAMLSGALGAPQCRR